MKTDLKYERELIKTKKIIFEQVNSKTKEEIIDFLYDNVFLFMPKGEYKKKLLLDIFEKSFEEKENNLIHFTLNEINFLKSLESDRNRKMFFCLIVWKKILHETRDFVEFNFDEIFSIAFERNQLSGLKREHLSHLVKYGLDFRSVGSKSAKPCYKLPDFGDSELYTEVNTKDLKEFFNNNLKG